MVQEKQIQTDSIQEIEYEERARTIIHSYAAAASFWEENVSKIPVVGTLGIMFGSDLQPVSAITAGMIIDLASMFECGYIKQTFLVTATHFVGTYMGIAFFRSLIGTVPIVGSVVNAGLVLQVAEVMGWASYLMFRDETIVTDELEEKDFKPYILKGAERAEHEMSIRKRKMESLTPDQRAQFDELARKLYKNVISSSRHTILTDIESIVLPWTSTAPSGSSDS